MLTLTTGANAPVDDPVVEIAVAWPTGRGSLDCSAYLLGEDGRVRDDAQMVFYNQPVDPAGAARMESAPGVARLRVELARVPAAVARIAMCATIEGSALTMQDFAGLSATLDAGGERRLRFVPELAAHRSLRVVELYRNKGRWKLRAVGQGFAAGLAKLAGEYGVAVEGGSAEPVPAPPPPPPPPAPPPPPPPPTPEPDPPRSGWSLSDVGHGVVDGFNRLKQTLGVDVFGETPPLPPSDEKITFELPTRPPPPQPRPVGDVLGPDRPAVRWPATLAGPVTLALEWTSRLGGGDGRPRALDLAFGCFFELTDGTRGVLQGDGRRTAGGDLLRLAAMTTTGAGGGQELLLDGARLAEVSALTPYAVIASGAPHWQAATVRLRIAVAGRLPVIVPVDAGEDGHAAVALARLTRSPDGLEIARRLRFAFREPELDALLGWNITWRS